MIVTATYSHIPVFSSTMTENIGDFSCLVPAIPLLQYYYKSFYYMYNNINYCSYILLVTATCC
jgi:hypothetical protein